MGSFFNIPGPDLRAECRDIEAQVAQLLRVVAGPVADPAAVAMLRMKIAPALGTPFERHIAEWPLARIAEEWDRFRVEVCAVLVSFVESDRLPRRAA